MTAKLRFAVRSFKQFVVALSLLGALEPLCASNAYSQASTDTLVVLLRQPWGTLDPAAAYDLGSYLVIGNVYEPLITFGDSPEDLIPWLSTAVPTRQNGLLSEDGLTYRFPLRKGVRFHDGTEMTPEDVRHSFLREIVIEEPGESSSFLLRPLLGVDSIRGPYGNWAVDPETVRSAVRVEGGDIVFELHSPFPGFLKMIASWPVVLSKSWAVKKGDWDGSLYQTRRKGPPSKTGEYLREHANGTGPYRVEEAYASTGAVRLVRHDAYWGEAPRLKEVLIRAEPSDAIRASMLQGGDADYVYLERPNLDLLETCPGLSIIDGLASYSSGETFFFTMEVKAKDNPRLGSAKLDGKGIPPDFFEDKDVRLGFIYAFDDAAYNRSALSGRGRRAAGPIPEALTPGLRLPNPYRHDPKKAEEAFRRAHDGKVWGRGFVLTLSYPRSSVRRQVAAEILKSGVEALHAGFKVNLEALAPGEYDSAYEAHRLPLFVTSLAADYPDPHAMAFQFFHSKGYFPRAQKLSIPELDRLEESAAAEPDPDRRRELFLQLEKRALGEAFQIYTYHPVQFKAVRSWTKGLDRGQNVNALGFLNLLYFPPLSKSAR